MALDGDLLRSIGRSMLKPFALAVLGLAMIGGGARTAAAAPRIDVPIGQLVLPNGDTRYFVQVTVGGDAPFDALLDTGSFGLRVLQAGVRPASYKTTDIRRSHPFASGTRFSGLMADATLGVGGARTEQPVLIQVIDTVGCVERRPNCPASKLSPGDFRMAGGGCPGQGFMAILGVSMRKAPRGEGAENPLLAMGDASWIIVLPLPKDTSPGHLIINPTDEDRAGFAFVQLQRQPGGVGGGGPAGDEDGGQVSGEGWMDGALPGCVISEATRQSYCGRTLLDTGAPGFSIDALDAEGPSSWRAGTRARFEIEGMDRPVAMSFVAGGEPSNRVKLHPPRNPGIMRISAGTLPYFSYMVLYDARSGRVGFKPRSDTER